MTDSRWARIVVSAVGFAVLIASPACNRRGKDLLSKSQTLAELRVVKRGVKVTPPGEAPRAPYPRERLVDGEKVELEAGGLAWLRRDGGATLLVSGPASLVVGKDAVELERGKVFADTQSSDAAELRTRGGVLHLASVRASVEAAGEGAVSAYVLAGGVHTDAGVTAGPGELLALAPGGKATRSPRTVWDDWTGGLATADPAARPAPYGVGTVGARSPGSVGEARFPLAIQRLDVRVTIDGDFATTEVDESFFNPTSDTVEGIYRFRTPDGAVLQRFGVDRDGELVWGRLKEKQAAAAQYQAHVYQGSTEDPALLEWDAPGVYRARLYPIEPGATRRVVTRYGEWLNRQGPRGERRLYVYPMAAEGAAASLPRIEELSFEADLSKAKAAEVRVGMLGKQDGNRVIVKRFDFVPRADLSLELFDAGGAGMTVYRAPHRVDREITAEDQLPRAEKDARGEADYVMLPVRPSKGVEPGGGLDLAIVVDSSAAIESGSLAIARALTGALLAHLGPTDRAAVWAGDATLRAVADGSDALATVDAARRDAIATGLARIERGGATDLGAILAEAATKLEENRRGAVVYLGDGQPTVGELAVKELRARLDRLPRPVRLFAIGVGDDADMGILKGLSRGAFAARVTDGFGAAESALRILEQAERPVWLGATVDFGSGVDRVFPRELGALAQDEAALVVGRVVGALPKQVTIRGPGGENALPVTLGAVVDGGDLQRRWAEGRLDQLLEEGAQRAALVEIGVRYGVVTPVTSYYVPTAAEHAAEKNRAVLADLAPSDEKPFYRWPWFGGFSLLRAPMGLNDEEPMAASAPAEEAANKEGGTGTRAKGEEGSMGKDMARVQEDRVRPTDDAPYDKKAPEKSGNKRYAVAGPKGDAFAAAAERDDGNRDEREKQLESAQEFGSIGLLGNAAGGGAAPPASDPAAPPVARAPAAPQSLSIRPGASGGGLGRIGGSAASKPMAEPAPQPTAAASAAPADVTDSLNAAQLDPLAFANDAPSAGNGAAAASAGGLSLGSGGGGLGDGIASRQRLSKQEKAKGGVVTEELDVRVRHTVRRTGIGAIGHAPVPCPASADLPFDDRRQLWLERLGIVQASAGAIEVVYRVALGRCEAPTWRDRTALLLMLVERLPRVRDRVALWKLIAARSPQAADVVYRAILVRVDTAEEIRELHDALGIRQIDPDFLEKALAGQKTPEERLTLLKGLVAQWPDDLELSLRLLDALEDAGRDAEARALARALRRRTDATTRVRTAVGELYLRLAKKASGAPRERDTVEARRTFGEIVEFSPEDPGARRRLGDLLRTHGWYEEALRQYESLARLTPDDASVKLLLAAAANGMGRVEEAVRWAEQAGGSASDDVNPIGKTARAMAGAFLAWARDEARRAGRTEEADRLRERARRLGSTTAPAAGNVRVIATWAHPEFHPDLWSNPLGSSMPAPDGNPLLGVAETVLPAAGDAGFVELRLAPADAERAARLGAEVILTAITDEGAATERLERKVIAYGGPEPSGRAPVRRFALRGGALGEVTP